MDPRGGALIRSALPQRSLTAPPPELLLSGVAPSRSPSLPSLPVALPCATAAVTMSDAKTDEMKALLQDWANRMAKPVEWQSDGEKGILFPNDGGKDFRNPDNSTEFKDEFPDRAWMMKKWMKEYRTEPPGGSTSGPEEYGEIPADIASKYDE